MPLVLIAPLLLLLELLPAAPSPGVGNLALERPSILVGDELVSASARRRLRALVDDFARLGLADEVKNLRAVLLDLGDSEEDHNKLSALWSRYLERAKPEVSEQARRGLQKQLKRAVRALEEQLQRADPQVAPRLAALVLELDAESVAAHGALGHIQHAGRWLSERELGWVQSAERVADLVTRARKLEVKVVHASSTLEGARSLYGPEAHRVSAQGIHLHGGIAAPKLERILRESLRAMALSQALRGGELRLPKFLRSVHLLLLSEHYEYQIALAEALDKRSISDEEYARQLRMKLSSFTDQRGWRTCGWRSEADFEALVLWEQSSSLLGAGVQPCLMAGHLNWLCLNLFGTSLPSFAWMEAGSWRDRSSSETLPHEDAFWRSSATGLYGCRAWMMAHMREGQRFPYSRAVVNELGKVTGKTLLKATLVNEYLQVSGELPGLIEATRERADRIPALEVALGRSLPELELEWSEWLFSERPRLGVLQRMAPVQGAQTAEQLAGGRLLERLSALRREAFGPEFDWFEEVELFPELSAQAKAHARYLTLNPDQGLAWPDAHEEYPGREGLTPGGAWAGLHSVIHFLPDPLDALEGWMASFYHRLPLLHPGLFGIGFGRQENVIVLDIGSLVTPYLEDAWVLWPPPGSEGIPTRFRPEIPNPVPGEDQRSWGYPITLQAFWRADRGEHRFEMQLFLGDEAEGQPLPCHFLTPTHPAFEKLAPQGAYGLIPRSHLEPGQRYTVRARCIDSDETQVWSFRTKRRD